MKKTLLMMTFVLCACYSLHAGPCAITNLAVYDASGFTCSIGNFTFSGFSYTPSGSVLIPDSSVTVTPETIGGETGFEFDAPWGLVNGQTLDSKIRYTATCDGCLINDWVLQIAGAGSGGNGFVNVAETSPEVFTGLTQSEVGGHISGVGSATFPPVDSLTVTKDILVNGGDVTDTSTQVSSVTNLFSTTSTVPEPSLLILCAGLVAVVPMARRRFGRRISQ